MASPGKSRFHDNKFVNTFVIHRLMSRAGGHSYGANEGTWCGKPGIFCSLSLYQPKCLVNGFLYYLSRVLNFL